MIYRNEAVAVVDRLSPCPKRTVTARIGILTDSNQSQVGPADRFSPRAWVAKAGCEIDGAICGFDAVFVNLAGKDEQISLRFMAFRPAFSQFA